MENNDIALHSDILDKNFDNFLISALEIQKFFSLGTFAFASGDISVKDYLPKDQNIADFVDSKNKSTVAKSNKVVNNMPVVAELPSINGDSIEKIFTEIREFNECILKKSAHNAVCGDGNCINPDVVIIGEAPGEEEDLSGVPFCGKSGKLLEKSIGLVGLDRKKNLFITNTVFWRPPNNRKPTASEINLCRPFVMRMIAVLKPKLIVLCGSTASSMMLNGGDEKMSDLVGKLFDYNNNIKLITLYHPSYLIRNPISKKNMWESLLVVKKYLSSFK